MAKRIKKLRKSKGVSRKEFCMGIVSLSHFSNIENERYLPSNDILICFARRLNVPKGYLLNPEKRSSKKLEEKIRGLNDLIEVNLDQCNREIIAFEKENAYIDSYYLEIEFYLLKVNYFIKTGELGKAHHFYINEIVPLIDERLSDFPTIITTLKKFKGILSYHSKNYDQAILDYKEYLKEKLDSREKAKVNYNMALCYQKKSDSYYAVKYALNALDKYLYSHDWAGTGRTYNLLGSLFKFIGNYEEANNYFKKALNLSKEMNLNILECKVVHNLGEMEKAKGNLEKAIDLFNIAIEYKEEVEYSNKAISYCSLIDTYIKCNQLENAKKYLEYAIGDSASDYYLFQLQVLREKINYLTDKQSNYESALQSAVDFFTNVNKELYFVYTKELGEYYLKEKKYKLAAHYFKNNYRWSEEV